MEMQANPQVETDRVRRYTSPEMLAKIEERMEQNIKFYAAQPPHMISERIRQLRMEWSVERYLQVKVASFGLLTTFLALTGSRKWAALTCGALGFFLYFGVKGFAPPLPLLRKMGVRTRGEIDREIYALKAIRGDFATVTTDRQSDKFSAHELVGAVAA